MFSWPLINPLATRESLFQFTRLAEMVRPSFLRVSPVTAPLALDSNSAWTRCADPNSNVTTFPTGAVDDDVDVCSLFGRKLDPIQVFDQAAVQDALSDDVEPLFEGG